MEWELLPPAEGLVAVAMIDLTSVPREQHVHKEAGQRLLSADEAEMASPCRGEGGGPG